MAKNTLPKMIFVYVCDRERDGTPILAAATKTEDIPHDQDGEKVGLYDLREIAVLKVDVRLV